MQKYLSKELAALSLAVLYLSLPVHAQKIHMPQQATLTRQVITPAIRTTFDRAVFNRKAGVEGFTSVASRPAAEYSLLFGYGNYNPVIGFQLKNMPDNILRSQSYEMFHPYKGTFTLEPGELIQVAPLVQRSAGEEPVLVSVEQATLPQLTEAIYFWRLLNPRMALLDSSSLVQHARKLISQEEFLPNGRLVLPDKVYELPNVIFLKHLLDPQFTPKTYGQLAEETTVYPKHVTLNANGFPVSTAEAEQARILDNYLMLSHPRVMGRFNSSNIIMSEIKVAYTPFVLTPEEHAAAEELLAKRHAVTKIPDNATPRQLLAVAYNDLASHNVPYNSPQIMNSEIHFAYPAYEHTALYRHVKNVITQADQEPWRESTDVSHLVVLDAIMGGIEFQSTYEFYRVLDAFEKLCREVPATPENLAHLQLLHKALLRAPGFWELLPDSFVVDADFPELSRKEIMQMRERMRKFANTNVRKWAFPRMNP